MGPIDRRGAGRRVDIPENMNVSCSKCPAKYAVPDDKVRGKKVRIKCKHCGAAIVVDGTHLAGADAKPAAAPGPSAARPAAAPRAADSKPAPEPKPAAAPRPAASKPAPEPKPASTEAKVPAAAAPAARAATPSPVAAPPPAISPAPVQRSARSVAKQTMLGVPLPAVGAAPAPPQADTSATKTPTPAPPAPSAPSPARQSSFSAPEARPRSARSASKRTIIGGLEAAPGSTPFVQRAGPAPAAGVPRPEPVSEPAPVSAPEPEWTVAITDEHHEEMDTHEVVALYGSGTIDEDTFIWKDGMDDWATPFEIPKIARALEARGLYPGGDASEASTVVAQSPLEAQSGGVWREPGSWNEPPVAPGADIDEVGFDDVTVSMAAPQAAELLRAAQEREAQRHSLPTEPPPPMAGQRAYADDSDDEPGPDDVTVMRPALSDYDSGDHSDDVTVMAQSPAFSAEGALLGRPMAPRPAAGAPPEQSAATPSPEPAQPRAPRPPQPSSASIDGRPTGARNESSVLFSLDALANKEAPDEQETSEDVFGLQAPPPSADDARAHALSAPDFGAALMQAPAPAPAPAPPPPSAPQATAPPAPAAEQVEQPSKGGSGAIWVALVVLLLAGGGFASYHFRYPPQMWSALFARFAPATAAPTAPATAPAASESAAAAPAPSAAAPASAGAPATSAASAAPTPGSPTQARTAQHNTKAPASTKPGTSPGSSASAAPGASAAPAASAAPPFDKNAAASALAGAAASAASCKQANTPAGTGRVVVTFMPNGRATNAVVSGDFAGTAVGGCVARLFRGAKVPPFSGSPVTVARSFVIH